MLNSYTSNFQAETDSTSGVSKHITIENRVAIALSGRVQFEVDTYLKNVIERIRSQAQTSIQKCNVTLASYRNWFSAECCPVFSDKI